MGDRLQMEINGKNGKNGKNEKSAKKTTLSGLFTRYTVLFCVNVVLILLLLAGVAVALFYSGILLPANYAEQWIKANAQEYRTAEHIGEELLPPGCGYGVYDRQGAFLYGNFAQEEIQRAWNVYRNGYAGQDAGKYYYFVEREDETVCAVSYLVRMRFRSEAWNEKLPEAEYFVSVMLLLLFLLLLGMNALLLSGRFSWSLQKRLQRLREVTAKIAESDLDFETERSDIKEVDEVMESLDRMKEALRISLQEQWEQESRKREEIAAITHDIKTPLTVIRGNAELLLEEEQTQEQRESLAHLLGNARQVEEYLERLRGILDGQRQEEIERILTAAEFEKLLREKADELAAVQRVPVAYEGAALQGELLCSVEMLLRAWGNILSNALEYTEPEQGIRVRFGMTDETGTLWFAEVYDYGRGFSAQDLRYADQSFYSGDESRHDRSHQGLGLAIAKQCMRQQGGRLSYGNWTDEQGRRMGAVVRMDFFSKK